MCNENDSLVKVRAGQLKRDDFFTWSPEKPLAKVSGDVYSVGPGQFKAWTIWDGVMMTVQWSEDDWVYVLSQTVD